MEDHHWRLVSSFCRSIDIHTIKIFFTDMYVETQIGYYLTSRNSFSLTRFPGIGQFISDTSTSVPTTAGGLEFELARRSSEWRNLYNELLTGLKDLAGATTTPAEWIQVFQPNQAVLDLVHNTYPNPAGP